MGSPALAMLCRKRYYRVRSPQGGNRVGVVFVTPSGGFNDVKAGIR